MYRYIVVSSQVSLSHEAVFRDARILHIWCVCMNIICLGSTCFFKATMFLDATIANAAVNCVALAFEAIDI